MTHVCPLWLTKGWPRAAYITQHIQLTISLIIHFVMDRKQAGSKIQRAIPDRRSESIKTCSSIPVFCQMHSNFGKQTYSFIKLEQ